MQNLELCSSKYNGQQHLELLLAKDGVGMTGGHHDGLTFMQKILFPVNGDFSGPIQAGDKGIAAGLVGADLLALVKGKQGYAQMFILRQRLADYLAFLIGNLFFQGKNLCFFDIFLIDSS